jgi:hypothetical protein
MRWLGIDINDFSCLCFLLLTVLSCGSTPMCTITGVPVDHEVELRVASPLTFTISNGANLLADSLTVI